MPLARAAELHQQVRETPVIEEIIIPEVATETADRVPQSTDVNDGNQSILSIISTDDVGISREAQSILHQIEASTRDWTRLQTLLKLPKEDIVDVVKNLFERVDVEHHGSVPWGKFCDAMLLLCGKRFSDIELTALCEHYNVTTGSSISTKLFQEIAVDGLFVVAQDELRNGYVNHLGVTPCAQRLRFLRMDFSSSGDLRTPPLGTSEVVQDENALVPKESPDAKRSPNRVMGIMGKRQQGTWRRAPIVMPSVSGHADLSCTGRSLNQTREEI